MRLCYNGYKSFGDIALFSIINNVTIPIVSSCQ
jgi:hypothetical protein